MPVGCSVDEVSEMIYFPIEDYARASEIQRSTYCQTVLFMQTSFYDKKGEFFHDRPMH